MLGVSSGLSAPVAVDHPLVRSVEVLERDGAVIVVVNSAEERGLRVDFDQDEDGFVIALRVAPSS